MGRYEVTKGQFAAFVRATGYRTDAERNAGEKTGCYAYKGGTKFGWKAGSSWRDPGFKQGDDEPVVCVSHDDTGAYIAWLNRETKGGYRLPSEAEWEYAARAGSESRYSFGSSESDLCRYGNGADQAAKRHFSDWTVSSCDDGYLFTAPVGSFTANPWGLHDVHGNVWEWTRDCWNGSYMGAPDDGRSWESSDCSRRVLRGGSWFYNPGYLRSAHRISNERGIRDIDSGFRLVRTR